MTDARKELSERIAEAHSRGAPLEVRGGGTKRFYGNPPTGEVLETGGLAGIAAYEPSELYISAGAGTRLADAEKELAGRGQMLAFEPQHFGAGATVGGMAACGLSGPRRPFAGAARDFILGAELADGGGALLRFGGRVIKNVAGFDLSRLSAGALGTLGVLTELTFRVVPRPESELTAVLDCDGWGGIEAANQFLLRGLPLTGTAWHGGVLHVRFSGAAESALRAARTAGGDILSEEAGRDFWELIREQRHEFFAGDDNLWRVGCAPLSAVSADSQLIEWRGAQRWFRGGRLDAEHFAERCGGHLTLFRAADAGEGRRFPELPAPVARLHGELKRVFDPSDILNRGRMGDLGRA